MGGSSTNKRIQFSAEDNGVVSLIDRLRQSAKELSRDMLSDALKYSTSAKEQNKYIEDQIRLLERRNKLETEGRLMTARQQYDSTSSRTTSQEGRDKLTQNYKKEVSQIKGEHTEDSMQFKLLREIVDTLKVNSKAEIKEEAKQDTEQKGFFSRLFGGKKDKEEELDPEKAYVESQKRGNKLDKKESESEDRRRSMIGHSSRAFNTTAGIGVQSNEIFMAAAAMALIPMVGQGLSMITNKLIQEGSKLQEGRLTLGRITGNPNVDMGKSGAGMGVDQSEFMSFAAQMSKNRGYSTEAYALGTKGFSDRVEGSALRLMGTEQMYGINRGALLNFDKNQRLDSNKRDTAGDIQNLIKYLKSEGAFGKSGKDMASLEEFVQIQSQFMQDQSKRLETVNTNSNASVLAAFQRVGGTFANPLTTGERIGTMNNAIVSPQNDFKQAMVYSTLRKIKPDADLFELKKMQEEGIFGQGVLSGVMKDLTNRGGSQGNKKIMLSEFFGLSANQSEGLFNSYQNNDKIFDDISSRDELFKKYGLTQDSQFVAGGARMTGSIDRMNAKMTNRIAPMGEKAVNWGEDKINEIEKNGVLSGVGSIFKDIGKEMAGAFKDAMGNVVDNVVKETKETMKIMGNGIKEDWTNIFAPLMGPAGLAKIVGDGIIHENTTKVPRKVK